MGYQPSEPILVPPLYSWPPRPVAAFRWLIFEMLFPWGLCWIALAFISWNYLTPSEQTMAVLESDWIGMIWLRNAALLLLVAGGLHWWLYNKAFSKTGFQVQHTLAIRRESKVSLEESSQGQHVLEPDQWLYNLDTSRVPDSLVSGIWTSATTGVGVLTGLSCTDAL